MGELHAGMDLMDGGVIDLQETLGTDDTFSGFSCLGQAGEDLAQWDLVYLEADGDYNKTDADAVATMPAVAMASAIIANTATGILVLPGSYVRNDGWSWTIGGLLYADTTTAGGMTQTAPSGAADVVQVVGIALTATIIYFNPSLVYAEVGA